MSLDKPGPPRDLNVTGTTENSVSLSWKPPKDDGGRKVTGYIIEKREALRMAWQKVGVTDDTSYKVPNLSEGVNYVFRVAAENEIGVGEPVEMANATAAKSPHSK